MPLRFAALLSAALLAAVPGLAGAADLALMPWPQSVRPLEGVLPVGGEMAVRWEGYRDAALDRAAARFQADLRVRTGDRREPAAPLVIAVAGSDPNQLTPAAREGYALAVGARGVRLEAEGPAGVLRGLATLRQLVERSGDGFALPFVTIEDRPRFAWRGLMLDPARHFLSLPALKRQVDAMERTKLNVLHLHLSDAEGFRVESRRFPRLTQVVGGGQFYSQDEIRELVAYAAARGVRIVPEFDVPGHAGAILAAYPELSASPVDPANRIALMGLALDPTKPQTLAFLRELFAEMAALFPDPYFHVGGDEVQAAAWTNNPEIRAYMQAEGLADTQALQARFFGQVRDIVRGLGKVAIGWEEVAAAPVADDVVIQVWRSSQATAHVTAQDNPVVLSAGYYLDLLRPGLQHYAVDPLDLAATPPTEPHDILAPAPTAPLTPEQAARVLGAEAPLWAEVVTEEMLDGRLWPRAALLAERFWSPATVRDPDDAARRLVPVQEGLRLGGVLDDAHRRRMAARLAPEDAEAVERLAAATGPIRNFGRLWEVFDAIRNGRRPRAPHLDTLADAAAPDSIEVHRLTASVGAYLGGDRAEAGRLRALLAAWRDNHPRFLRAAEGDAELMAAAPVSADLAALAQAGLEAIEAVEHNRRPDEGWRTAASALLQRQADAVQASSSIPVVKSGAKQPPANLLIIATPPIARLIAAALALP